VSNGRRLCGRVRNETAPVSTRRRRLVQSSLAVGACVALGARGRAAEGSDGSPAAPVERLHAALLDASADGETARARFERLLPVVSEVFDFTTMSRVAVGSAWEEFGEDERRALEEHFAAYAAANYADNFDDASGLAFRTVEVGGGEGARVHVVAELTRPADDPVEFDYLVQRTAAGPRIVNVVVDGTMNELARRRAEFRTLLRAGGLANLLDTLDAQTTARLG
jgi:phospholipid transport system substrate-binding protein